MPKTIIQKASFQMCKEAFYCNTIVLSNGVTSHVDSFVSTWEVTILRILIKG